MYIACKCLNVIIGEENVNIEGVEVDKLGLSVEQRDHLFKEKLGSLCTKNVKFDASLVEVRQIGAWLAHQCLVCQTHTHAALSIQPQQLLINLNLIITKEEILRLRQSGNYSIVFDVLVDLSINQEPVKKLSTHPAVASLNRKLAKALQTELDAMEEAVRIFKEKKYAEFEEFREKAHRDHKTLSSIFNDTDNNTGSLTLQSSIHRNSMPLGKENVRMGSQLASKLEQTSKVSSSSNVPNRQNRNSATSKNSINMDCYKEDSLDSEGIFDLEGTDPPHNGLNSDVYDSDSDDSVSRDEGIHISRDSTQPWNTSIAKSLPVNVPAFTQFHEMSQERLDQHGEDPQDIAASIKALARSVHGDVFGDLPRPRFSTQI